MRKHPILFFGGRGEGEEEGEGITRRRASKRRHQGYRRRTTLLSPAGREGEKKGGEEEDPPPLGDSSYDGPRSCIRGPFPFSRCGEPGKKKKGGGGGDAAMYPVPGHYCEGREAGAL